jgi:hypothetical protein
LRVADINRPLVYTLTVSLPSAEMFRTVRAAWNRSMAVRVVLVTFCAICREKHPSGVESLMETTVSSLEPSVAQRETTER